MSIELLRRLEIISVEIENKVNEENPLWKIQSRLNVLLETARVGRGVQSTTNTNRVECPNYEATGNRLRDAPPESVKLEAIYHLDVQFLTNSAQDFWVA